VIKTSFENEAGRRPEIYRFHKGLNANATPITLVVATRNYP
jgi:hypothetical protein